MDGMKGFVGGDGVEKTKRVSQVVMESRKDEAEVVQVVMESRRRSGFRRW